MFFRIAAYDSAMKTVAASLVVILLGSALCCGQADAGTPPDVITCGGSKEAQTVPVRSSAGFTAVVSMQSDDDHGKNTHLCMAEYTLHVTRPDGSPMPPYQMLDSDADWGRSLVFRTEGFSADGNHVFLLISEGTYPGDINIIEYDMSSGSRVKRGYIFLDRHFTRQLSRACAATLHIAGISPAKLIVLGSDAKDGCTQAELWQLRPNKNPGNGRPMPPEYPTHLPPGIEITKLEAGVPVQP